MKKIAIPTLAAVLLLSPLTSHAAVDRAIVDYVSTYDIGQVQTIARFMDGTSQVDNALVIASIGTVDSPSKYQDAVNAAVSAHASGLGYVLSNGIIWPHQDYRQVQASASSTVSALIAQATSTMNLPQAMVFSTTTRSLNSNYTISGTRAALASYSVNASWTLNALLGGSANAFLEYSTNGGTTWVTANSVGHSLSILSTTGSIEMNVAAPVPSGALVRIRTTSSNMTLSFVRSSEMLFATN